MKNLLSSCCLLIVFFGSTLAQAAPAEIPLIAGKMWPVGTVYTWNDGSSLYIQLELDEVVIEDGWCLADAKLHIAQDLQDFPLNKSGNPKLGQFDYKLDLGCAGLADPIEIELGELADAETLLIAVQADLLLEECEELDEGQLDCITYCEGAWAEGTRFRSKGSWAMYFEYDMESPEQGPQSCCDLTIDIITFNPMAIMSGPSSSSYTFTICDDVAVEAFGPDSEVLSNLSYDSGAQTISFTVTYPDSSTWSPSFTLVNDGTILSSNLQMPGFWNWSNCTE